MNFSDVGALVDDTVLDSAAGVSHPGSAALRLPSGDSYAIWDVFRALSDFIENAEPGQLGQSPL